MTITPLSAVTRLERPDAIPLALGALTLGTLVLTASAEDGIVLCPFRRCTGGYCPGCGATRAANRLVRGDVAASWSIHPWVVLAAAQAIVIGIVLAVITPGERRGQMRRAAIPLTILNGVALVSVWIIRLFAGSIPTGWLSALV